MNPSLTPTELIAILLSLIFYAIIIFCINESPTGFSPDCPTCAPAPNPTN